MSDDPIDTGLGDLIVESIKPAEQSVTVAVTAPSLASLPTPDGYDIPKLALLARDLAIMLYETPIILEKHGITPEQHKALQENEFFKGLLIAAAADWHSVKSIKERLALEGAMVVEDALPTLSGRLKNKQEPLASVVQGITAVSKIAGLGEKTQAEGKPGEKFTITINLGADKEVYEKNRTPGKLVEIQPLPEGDGENSSVQLIPFQTGNPNEI